jgi:hypothetical protein
VKRLKLKEDRAVADKKREEAKVEKKMEKNSKSQQI